MKPYQCRLLVFFLSWILAHPILGQVRLCVQELPIYTPDNALIYVSGSFNQWNEGDTAYQLTYDSAQKHWSVALPVGLNAFEYHFSRGHASNIEADSLGNIRSNRVYISQNNAADTLLYHKISLWRDRAAHTTFRIISLPENTPEDAHFYLAGNFNGWTSSHPDYQLVWKDGYYCFVIPPTMDSIAYKFTRGSWNNVEGGYSGGFRPNRFYKRQTNKPETIDIIISSWEDLSENVFSAYSFAGLLLSCMGLMIVSMLVSIDGGRYTYTRPLLLIIGMYAFAFITRVATDASQVFSFQPRLYFVPELVWFIYAPVYYYFLRQITHREIDPVVSFKWHWAMPFALHILALLPLIIRNNSQFTDAVISQDFKPFVNIVGTIALIFNIVWWIISQRALMKAGNYGKEAVPLYRLKLLKRLQAVYAMMLLCWLITFILGGIDWHLSLGWLPITDMGVKTTWLIFGLPSIFITYYALKYPEIFKRKRSGTGASTKEKEIVVSQYSRFQKSLDIVMIKEKAYLNAQISIKDVATMIGTNTHTLSMIINETHQKNFNDYINGFRVKAFIELAEKAGNDKNFSALAYESGFNSKATFNRAFKKITGVTPSEYFDGNVK